MYKYLIVLSWSETGQEWIAIVPELPYLAVDGTTLQEAIDNTQEAIRVWVKTAQEDGMPIPPPRSYDEQEIA